MDFYTTAQRNVQARFEDRPLADRLEETIIKDELDEMHVEFIESRDFFYLSTVDEFGMPTVSYKGGDTGVVTVIDPSTLAFPTYDGNGMHLSEGNLLDTGKVGLLFMDFETPRRVRVQGHATVSDNDPLLERYPGAIMIVRVEVSRAFRNCARYIHKHQRIETSHHVPTDEGSQPFPLWKRIYGLQTALPASAVDAVTSAGGAITAREYAERMIQGES